MVPPPKPSKLPACLQLDNYRFLREYLAALSCLFCVFNFGTTLGWEILAKDIFTHENEHGVIATDDEWKLISCSLPVGATISSLPVGLLAKKYGCKYVIYLQTIPYFFSWMILIFTKTILLTCISRFLQGICGAAVCVAAPLYIMDISRMTNRGRIGSLFFGVLMYGLYFTYFLAQLVGMDTMNLISLGLVVLNLFLVLVPESPTYYVYHNKMAKAKAALHWLHTKKNVELELNSLKILVEDRVDSKRSFWLILWKTRGALQGVIMAAVIMALFSLCGGMMLLIDRTAMIFDFAKSQFYFYNQCLFIALMVGNLTCFLIIDRLGRRPLLLICTLMMVSFSILLFFNYEWKPYRTRFRMMPVTFCFFYAVAFAVGLGPVSWILGTEFIFTQIHCYGNAIMVCSCWFFFTLSVIWLNFVQSKYLMYALMFSASTVTFSFTLLCVPELASVSLPRIQVRMVPSLDAIASTTSASVESLI